MTNDKFIIRHGMGSTPAGRVLVAISPRGLCAVKFVDDAGREAAALKEIRRGFPRAELVRDQRAAGPIVRRLNSLLAGRPTSLLKVDLDLQGTPFQQRVWRMLTQVPRGKTWSYSELARRAGAPRAVRAAASACAANPIAILVPCHRIVRSDSSLGGYGGGVERKKKLLQIENENSPRRNSSPRSLW